MGGFGSENFRMLGVTVLDLQYQKKDSLDILNS